MPSFFPLSSTRNTLLSIAREHSPIDEAQCHALLELFETCNLLGAALRREMAPPDLTETGFRILVYLLDRGSAPITLGDARRKLGLSRRTVSIVLRRLEESGLVSIRQISDNHRVFAVRITPAGRRAFTSALSHYIEVITHVMSVLDPKAIAALDQTCAHLRHGLPQAPDTADRSIALSCSPPRLIGTGAAKTAVRAGQPANPGPQ